MTPFAREFSRSKRCKFRFPRVIGNSAAPLFVKGDWLDTQCNKRASKVLRKPWLLLEGQESIGQLSQTKISLQGTYFFKRNICFFLATTYFQTESSSMAWPPEVASYPKPSSTVSVSLFPSTLTSSIRLDLDLPRLLLPRLVPLLTYFGRFGRLLTN